MITYTAHARAMMAERDIAQDWVERTLAQPDLAEPDPIHPDRRRAFRTVPERGGRVLRVVYPQADDAVRVINLFLDRSRSRMP